MRKMSVLFAAFLCVAAFASVAGASALLVQDVNPWGETSNQDDMDALGMSYVMSSYASVDWDSLCSYDFVLLVAGDGNGDSYFNNAASHLTELESFVACGGLLLIHYTPWDVEWHAGDIAPGGVESTWSIDEYVDIDSGHAADPLVTNVTNASLDNWGNSSHLYFTDLVAGTENVLVREDGNGPSYLRYGIGAGEVWLTSMPLEWYRADADVLWNELTLAGDWPGCAVPEPASIISLCAGLALLGGNRLRKRS